MLNIKKSILLSSFLITSCTGANKQYYPIKQCENQDEIHTKYQKCDLEDIKDYYDVIIDNSKVNNNVVLYLYGGPMISSPAQTIRDNFAAVYNETTQKDIGYSYYLMNQIQYLKQKKFLDGNLENFTYEDGYKEHMETVDNVHKVIKHLKASGKKVGLVGISYGGFVINSYLAKYGDDTPNFVLATGQRLKMKNGQNLLKAWVESLETNEFVVDVLKDDAIKRRTLKTEGPRNDKYVVPRIGIANLIKDYTKLIKDTNLNKTTFLSAAPDARVGWFNQEEISWARSRNANVVFFDEKETTRQYDLYFPDDKSTGEERAIKIGDFAHSVGYWNWEQGQKYFVKPFSQ